MIRALAFTVSLLGSAPLAAQVVTITPAQIDDHLARAQGAAEVRPSPRASDAEFLRRLSLDVRGVIPSLEETISFMIDERPDKRARVIEEYLASDARGDYWAVYWDKLLVGQMTDPGNPTIQRQLKSAFRDWVADQFNANQPYDTFVADIVSAHGSTTESPQNLPLARWRRAPESMAGSVSRVFLGADIQCAQCHDHKDNPEMTQEKFWQFASFFGNTRAAPLREMQRTLPIVEVVDIGVTWRFEVPDTEPKLVVEPAYLDGSKPAREFVDGDGKEVSLNEILRQGRRFRNTEGGRALAAMESTPDSLSPQQLRALVRDVPRIHDTRRNELARMMTENDREQLARNFVNRMWARYFGRGLAEPLDGWVTPPKPDHPELLEALTQAFIASDFDVRALESSILRTHAYARSSAPTETSIKRPELFAHSAVRPLAPDQLINSLAQATRSATIAGAGGQRAETLRLNFERQFLFAFESDELEWTTTFNPSIPRALFFLNDPTINQAVTSQGETFLASLAAKTTEPEAIMDYLFLTVLSRYPDETEKSTLLPALREVASNRVEATRLNEDLLWALLTSTEFITNH